MVFTEKDVNESMRYAVRFRVLECSKCGYYWVNPEFQQLCRRVLDDKGILDYYLEHGAWWEGNELPLLEAVQVAIRDYVYLNGFLGFCKVCG